MKLILLLVVPLLLLASTFHTPQIIKDNSAAVVKIFNYAIEPNYYIPWNMKNQTASTGSGVVIENRLILTAAHVVSNNTYLQVQKSSDSKKYIAHVKWIAHDADLALLELEDDTFFTDTKAIKIGELPKRQDGVAVYGYPTGGSQISITQGIISRIELTTYVHSSVGLLAIQIDAAINPGNSGGPAFNQDGEIVGITMQGIPSSNGIGYIVPVPIIKHFLKDIEDNKYDGFPEDGIYIEHMENSDLKHHYKTENQSGILVTSVIKNSPAEGILKTGDVILKIDNHIIADDNTVKADGLERVLSAYIVQKHFIGESVSFDIIRDGKKKNIQLELKPSKSIIPLEHEVRPKYYIFGGVVFMPLTQNFLKSWGKKWRKDAPLEFLYQLYHAALTKDAKKEIVFIKTILPDRINAGYTINNQIVESVNGVSINTFNDLVNLIEKSKNDVKIVTSFGSTIILDKQKALKAERQLLNHYAIKEKMYLRESK